MLGGWIPVSLCQERLQRHKAMQLHRRAIDESAAPSGDWFGFAGILCTRRSSAVALRQIACPFPANKTLAVPLSLYRLYPVDADYAIYPLVKARGTQNIRKSTKNNGCDIAPGLEDWLGPLEGYLALLDRGSCPPAPGLRMFRSFSPRNAFPEQSHCLPELYFALPFLPT